MRETIYLNFDEQQMESFNKLAEAFRAYVGVIQTVTHPGRERELAMNDAESAHSWARKALFPYTDEQKARNPQYFLNEKTEPRT